MRRHIPNTITCCNLLSGCVAATYAFEGIYTIAFVCIIMGAVFDFFDGLTARALKVSSPIGKELDSLADVVTFGFAPAAMVFSWLRECADAHLDMLVAFVVPFLAFLLVAFSALRLAKFNVDERQTSSFIGLPTPANALFWGALVLGSHDKMVASPFGWVLIVALVLLFSWLLVAEIPMFSLKFKSLAWKPNRIAYIFLLVSLVLLICLGLNGLSAVIGWYIILSVLTQKRA
ncbi:MAG: CDP-alcohol phosphatidyltransferase family protein [Bacteroidaceae bacterium]|nr:CDP-alcohol phosphatidyltransferase family protein [Bacteroidaceae bacterium]MBR5149349.1 CDP-alcohol phosphatidyltransferase family protein [Bacteroidaceae bacterium]